MYFKYKYNTKKMEYTLEGDCNIISDYDHEIDYFEIKSKTGNEISILKLSQNRREILDEYVISKMESEYIHNEFEE